MNESNDFIGNGDNDHIDEFDEFAFIDDFEEEPEEDEMPADLPAETVERIEEAMGRITPEFVREQLRKLLITHGLELQDDPADGPVDEQVDEQDDDQPFDQRINNLLDLISASDAWQKAADVMNAARKEHDAIINEADAKAQEILDEAHHNAAQIEDEALSTARRMIQAAEKRVNQILRRLRLLPQPPGIPDLQITSDFSAAMPGCSWTVPLALLQGCSWTQPHMLRPTPLAAADYLETCTSPSTISREVVGLSNCNSHRLEERIWDLLIATYLEAPAIAQYDQLALPSAGLAVGPNWAQLYALPDFAPNLRRLADISADVEARTSSLRVSIQVKYLRPTAWRSPAEIFIPPEVREINKQLTRHWKAANAQMRTLRKVGKLSARQRELMSPRTADRSRAPSHR